MWQVAVARWARRGICDSQRALAHVFLPGGGAALHHVSIFFLPFYLEKFFKSRFYYSE